MEAPLLVHKHLPDWLSINFHYPYSIQREQQRKIIAEAIKTIGQQAEAVKMDKESITAYQTKNFLFVNINKRFLQIQFQGKYFLEHGLIEAGRLIKKTNDRLLKLESIEGRPDTEITLSMSRLDIQKTRISTDSLRLMNVEKDLENLKSFDHSVFGRKRNGEYRILGETIRDKIRWKLRRYDKTAQVKSEYTEQEQDLFFTKYPDVQMERSEIQITDTPFLNQFFGNFYGQKMDLVEIVKKWNAKRKVQIVESELLSTSPLIESSLKTFNQKGVGVGLCKAHPSDISEHFKKLNDWIDKDPMAKPEEIIRQMVFGLGHGEEIAEAVKKIFFKI